MLNHQLKGVNRELIDDKLTIGITARKLDQHGISQMNGHDARLVNGLYTRSIYDASAHFHSLTVRKKGEKDRKTEYKVFFHEMRRSVQLYKTFETNKMLH